MRRTLVVCVLLSSLGCASSRKPSSQVKVAEKVTPAEVKDQPPREPLSSLAPSVDASLFDPLLLRNYDILLANPPALPLPGTLDEAGGPFSPSTPLDELADLNLFTIEVDPHLREIISKDLLETRYDIPVVVNDRVLRFLNHYQTRRRDVMERGLRRSGKYTNLFRKIFKEEGVPLDLVYMPHTESLFNPYAYSRARAKGIWQFMKWTGLNHGLRQDWWIDERSDIVKSTQAAARYLKKLHERFQDWYLALAAYNVGPARIQRIFNRYGPIDYWTMVRRRLLPRETRNYVPSILASLIIYRNPQHYGFNVELDPEIQFETLSLEYQVDLGVVSESIGVSLAELEELNPELRYGITPKEYKEYQLKVPLGTAEPLESRLAALPPEKRLQLQHHRVKRGETLSVIAGKYGIPLKAISHINRIRNIHRIREGQDLIIPISGRLSSGWGVRRGRGHTGSRRHPGTLSATYRVRRGDSLGRIARLYGVTVKELQRWNNLKPGAFIYPRQKLTVRNPSRSNHVVKKGDSLDKIARLYGVTVRELQRWNDLSPGAFIHPGQEVKVAVKTSESKN